jgi:thymidylate kinase
LDGSGKSTVLGKLEKEFESPGVAGIKVVYRRPNISGQSTVKRGPAIKHYTEPPHGQVKSIVKLVIRAVDWWLGYWSRWAPQRARGYLVLLDRHYFLDISVDPLRYRYSGPLWLAYRVGQLLPKPDLFILLDAPVEVLQGRKQEVAPEEGARQRDAYLDLVRNLPNGYIVDASQPLDQVVSRVKQIILDHIY